MLQQLNRIEQKLDLLLRAVGAEQREIQIMSSAIEDLTAQVAADTEVVASATKLLNGLKAELDAAIASGDPTKLAALSAQLGANNAALAAAVAANTPAPATPTV